MPSEIAVSSPQVRRATVELQRMKGSLASWLKYRKLNDAVLAGQARTKVPPDRARAIVASSRDSTVERDLAVKLHTLLTELGVPGLPDPTSANAPMLASIALAGGNPAMGGLGAGSQPWLWPVLIVGGLLLAVTTAVKSAADVATERERYACIQAGACTDYGFWLKAGGGLAIGWFAWKELGVGDAIRRLLKKGKT